VPSGKLKGGQEKKRKRLLMMTGKKLKNYLMNNIKKVFILRQAQDERGRKAENSEYTMFYLMMPVAQTHE
jgi:hypothetical protein